MRDLSYTFIVDDVNAMKEYYEKHFNWKPENETENFCLINTYSPFQFSVVQREYLLTKLEAAQINKESDSFCTWFYETKEELLQDKAEMLKNGMKEIGKYGDFLQDTQGVIWELRVEGDRL